MSTYFLSIQGSYINVEIALFKDDHVLDTVLQQDVKASSHLVPFIDELLKKHNLALHDLSFIAVDKGPGAFTSLRVSIATVNGIAFARTVPLIGVDGLDCLARHALSQEKELQKNTVIVCLLNAFHSDAYFGLYDLDGRLLTKGCENIQLILEQIAADYASGSLFFTGNGAALHRELIVAAIPQAGFQEPLVMACPATAVGEFALERWKGGEQSCYKIEPNYLKTQVFTPQKK